MRPDRQVRRSSVRPSYARGQSPKRRRPKLSLPALRITSTAWLRLLFMAVAVFMVIFFLGKITALTAIRVTGTHTLSSEHVNALARTGLNQQWFGHNLLLVNGSALASYLQQADPSIKQATIHRTFFHRLSITVSERQPTLNWKTAGGVYLLDADATVIGPTMGDYAKLPVVTDSSNLPVKTGQRVAPTSFVTFCSQLVAQLPAAGYQIGEMTVPTSTSEVYVRTTSNLLLKFDTTRLAGGEINDLKAVQSELAKAKKTPTQYIDLRIEHKAYYK